ncbi:glycosyltransferase family 4 protein [Methylobacterium sp. V23]|uniref:glycosyltransferase family 4 protein n=1 Tax=Methylobacterium sp. V23 TaxID=2044878 RepID=UPI000CDA17EA|nr:glycosyltransferase family 4 protein [Methylobacterium sp. V23]POR40313.1 glycosyl transferase family 1 [Methylobacterium sp. V23]
MKVLVVAHAHPDFSVGGAEIAAYNLFTCLKEKDTVSDITFLARTDLISTAPGSIALRRAGEFLWRQDIGDWFKMRTAYPRSMATNFRDFLLSKSPDFVFVHHYSHIGVEMLEEIKVALPDCKLVLTLHEYGAICNRQGQMLKNKTDRLCNNESPEECHLCFPERSPEDFWLRKRYLQKHFALVDHFISPSEFLRRRYITWGVDEDRISVIENGQPSFDLPHTEQPRQRAIKIGYFGQVNKYKGLDVLLRAAALLPETARARLQFQVHGANLAEQDGELKKRLSDLVNPLIEQGLLHWVGPYDRSELMRRMLKVDWVVVPSIWWENSPMVIQEAFACRKPVLCSGIGGMAEKVRDGVDGFHFDVGNPLDLVDKLVTIAETTGLTQHFVERIRAPLTYEESAEEYLRAAIAAA